MDRADTTRFIREAKAFARRKRWKLQTLSRHLFNGNPYGLERLENAMRGEKDGPPHVRVLEAAARLKALKEAEEEERAAA